MSKKYVKKPNAGGLIEVFKPDKKGRNRYPKQGKILPHLGRFNR